MGEAVHLRVPMYSVPLTGQYEQELNARYLAKLDYGRWAPSLEEEEIVAFLDGLDAHQNALMSYEPRGNEMLFNCVDELLRRAELGEARPETLGSPSLGDRLSSRIDATLASDPDEAMVGRGANNARDVQSGAAVNGDVAAE